MTFEQFLIWAQDPGIAVVVGVVVSIAAEYVPQFGALERKWKLPVILAVNVGVPLAAAGVAIAMGYQSGGFDATYWPALVAGVAAFVGGQGNWVRAEIIKFKMFKS